MDDYFLKLIGVVFFGIVAFVLNNLKNKKSEVAKKQEATDSEKSVKKDLKLEKKNTLKPELKTKVMSKGSLNQVGFHDRSVFSSAKKEHLASDFNFKQQSNIKTEEKSYVVDLFKRSSLKDLMIASEVLNPPYL